MAPQGRQEGSCVKTLCLDRINVGFLVDTAASSRAAVPNLSGTRDRFVEDSFSMGGWGGRGGGPGGNARDGERQT